MKNKLFFISTLLFATHIASAQVLYSENFDNLTLGDVGTDFTGATAGQGGWYTLSQSSEIPSENSNSYFKIVSEPGRGKVLELATTPGKGATFLQKRGIDALWVNRNTGNNILKIEIDFYTGDQFSDGGTGFPIQGGLCAIKSDDIFDATSNDVIGLFYYRPDTENISQYGNGQQCAILGSTQKEKLKTWVKIIYYLDFTTQKIYFTIPSNNHSNVCSLSSNTKSIKSLLFKNSNSIGDQATIPVHKYDNIIISAVNTVPLSLEDFISEKFNVYPNPTKNVVNITNTENIGIKEIKIYDINGKLIDTKVFDKQSNLQVDISAYATGTYLLHIDTTEGTAIKKVVKK